MLNHFLAHFFKKDRKWLSRGVSHRAGSAEPAQCEAMFLHLYLLFSIGASHRACLAEPALCEISVGRICSDGGGGGFT